jgi:hypothetical protein
MNVGDNQPMLNQSLMGAVPELAPDRDAELNAADAALLSVNRRMEKVAIGIIFGADCALAAAILTLSCQSDKCLFAAEVLAVSGLGIMLTTAGVFWCKFGCPR